MTVGSPLNDVCYFIGASLLRDDRLSAEDELVRAYHRGLQAAGVEGYAVYRQKDKWDDFPEGEIRVLELMAATPDAHEALWRYLTRIDLFPRVEYWNLPVDDELPWRVVEARRVRRQGGGVSGGLMEGRTVLDMDYEEDACAQVDRDLVMTGDLEIIEIQGTAEKNPFPRELLNRMLEMAEVGITQRVEAQLAALGGKLV